MVEYPMAVKHICAVLRVQHECLRPKYWSLLKTYLFSVAYPWQFILFYFSIVLYLHLRSSSIWRTIQMTVLLLLLLLTCRRVLIYDIWWTMSMRQPAYLASQVGQTGEINFPEPFSKICANRLPVFIISFLPLATLLQFLGYVLAPQFLALLHEQKSFNHL